MSLRFVRAFVTLAACTTMAAACHPRAARVVPRDSGTFVTRMVVVDRANHFYKVFVPAGPAPAGGHPVVLFLHGAGERGEDNQSQLEVGLGPVVRQQADSFPAIVVFPQLAPTLDWLGEPSRAAMRALEATITEFGADTSRLYLTGISMGAYGAWELASRYPDRWAAVVPVAGGVRAASPEWPLRIAAVPAGTVDTATAVAARLRALPTWIFHGDIDPVIPVERSREMHTALQQAGAPVRYTELPGVRHNAWDPAYADAALWEWLLAQRR